MHFFFFFLKISACFLEYSFFTLPPWWTVLYAFVPELSALIHVYVYVHVHELLVVVMLVYCLEKNNVILNVPVKKKQRHRVFFLFFHFFIT